MERKTFADTIDNVGSFTIQKSLLSSIYPMQLSSSSVSTLVWDAWVGILLSLGLLFCNLDWREYDFLAQCYQCRCLQA